MVLQHGFQNIPGRHILHPEGNRRPAVIGHSWRPVRSIPAVLASTATTSLSGASSKGETGTSEWYSGVSSLRLSGYRPVSDRHRSSARATIANARNKVAASKPPASVPQTAARGPVHAAILHHGRSGNRTTPALARLRIPLASAPRGPTPATLPEPHEVLHIRASAGGRAVPYAFPRNSGHYGVRLDQSQAKDPLMRSGDPTGIRTPAATVKG